MDYGSAHGVQWRLLAVCSLLLYVKFLVTTMIQGRRGFQAGTRLPEDAALPMATRMPPAIYPSPTHAFHGAHHHHHTLESDLRWKRMVQNDLESLPFALAVFTISMLVGGNARVNCVALTVYTGARICHTVLYAMKQAVPRMVVWLVGVLCLLTAGSNGVYAALTF